MAPATKQSIYDIADADLTLAVRDTHTRTANTPAIRALIAQYVPQDGQQHRVEEIAQDKRQAFLDELEKLAPLASTSLSLLAQSDAKLIANGYEPIAVVPATKRPAGKGWNTRPNTIDAIAAERATHPEAISTGIRTGHVVGLDVDVVEPAHVEKIKALAFDVLGATPLDRFGSKGAMLVYRNETPLKKIKISTTGKAAIEVLGQGQQFVAFGIHPDTGKPFEWRGDGTPLTVPVADLPEVTPDMLRAFVERAKSLLVELGYQGVMASEAKKEAPKPSQATGRRVSWEGLRIRLGYIHPQFSGARPTCYPPSSGKRLADPLKYDMDHWAGIGRCILEGEIPLLDTDAHDWLTLCEEWCDGVLWNEQHPGAPVPIGIWRKEDDLGARLQGGRGEGQAKIHFGTIFEYAADGGCTLPSDDEPKPSAGDAFADYIEKHKDDEPKHSTPKGKPDWLKPYSYFKGRPRPQWLIPGLLPARGLLQVNGESQHFKTFVLLDPLVATATGLPVFGNRHRMPRHTGRSVYIPTEDEEDVGQYRAPLIVHARIKALGLSAEQAAEVWKRYERNFQVSLFVPQVNSEAEVATFVDGLNAWRDGEPILAAMVDHRLGLFGSGMSENDANDAQRIIKFLQRLQKECDVRLAGMTSHPRRGGSADEARGSSAAGAGVDASLTVKRSGQSLVTTVSSFKMKGRKPIDPIHLQGTVIEVPGERDPDDGTPITSIVFTETSASTLATLADADRYWLILAMDHAGAKDDASALASAQMEVTISQVWAQAKGGTFPLAGDQLTPAQEAVRAEAKKLLKRARERGDQWSADLWFATGTGNGARRKWRLQPDTQVPHLPAHDRDRSIPDVVDAIVPTSGTVPDCGEEEAP